MTQRLAVLLFTLSLTACDLYGQESLPKLIKKVMPSIVTIITYNDAGEMKAQGTGFIVNPTGNVVTNRHVLEGADSAQVKYQDGQIQAVASIVAENRESDIILISTSKRRNPSSGLTLSMSSPEIGEHVLVVGAPMGLENTVSDGIVSAIRTVPEFGSIIQISAPISPGSSGSPVINSKGEVIGVATFQYVQGQNLNFAIPSIQISKAKIVQLSLPYSTSAKLGTIIGDFDGDGKSEIAWIVGPKLTEEGIDCVGKCECKIQFSTDKVRQFQLGDCIPGRLHNEGDLDDDGADDLSLLPGRFTSAWRRIHIFSYKNNSWQEIIDPFTIYIGDDFTGQRIMRARPGFITIVTDRWNDTSTEIIHERKEVKIN